MVFEEPEDALIRDLVTKAAKLWPVTPEDRDLVEKARMFIDKTYEPGFHHLASAGLGLSGAVHYGLQLDQKIGQASLCAEQDCLSSSEKACDTLVTIATVHHGHELSGTEWRVVTPCAMCRDRLIQFYPRLLVIIPFEEELVKVKIKVLHPLPYSPRERKIILPKEPASELVRDEWIKLMTEKKGFTYTDSEDLLRKQLINQGPDKTDKPPSPLKPHTE